MISPQSNLSGKYYLVTNQSIESPQSSTISFASKDLSTIIFEVSKILKSPSGTVRASAESQAYIMYICNVILKPGIGVVPSPLVV